MLHDTQNTLSVAQCFYAENKTSRNPFFLKFVWEFFIQLFFCFP